MKYPWSDPAAEPVLDDALDVALGYLEFTGNAYPYSDTRSRAAQAIWEGWRAGYRHKIRLANCAIVTIENGQASHRTKLISLGA
jgi:hypothetical protein